MKVLEAKNIIHRYDEKEVLKNISIEIEEKEFLVRRKVNENQLIRFFSNRFFEK